MIDLPARLAALAAAEEPRMHRVDPDNPPRPPCWIWNGRTWIDWGINADSLPANHPIDWDDRHKHISWWHDNQSTCPTIKPLSAESAD